MIKAFLHPLAQAEFESEIDFYETERQGWGGFLRPDVLTAIQHLVQFPTMGRAKRDGTRRFVTKRFRFIVSYELRGEVIIIWAVSHGARKPGYWHDRRPHSLL